MRRVFRWLMMAVGVGLALGAVVGVWGYSQVQGFLSSAPSPEHTARIVEIPKGSTPARIAAILEEQGIVTDADRFRWFIRFENAGPKLKAGELEFYTDMTPRDVLRTLIEGKQVTYRLTVPEGYRINDMVPLVAAIPFLDGEKFRTLATSEAVATELGVGAPTLEGFLFPDTYLLTRGEDERALIKRMVGRFNEVWTFDARAKELGLTRLQVVSLASVIEKETGQASERPLIGSVFHNRLKIGMKLQSDPTIIYGLPNYDGNIRRKDILYPHPWNTYVIEGIPPTPIASPGEGALKAALWPDESKYLYFVAKNDSTHSFSETYAEHAAKVVQYQLRGKGR